ncbi:polysaccharide biosynthesis/export family protein [Flavimarina sp. Hel_I_48]|uniref:polysaccharide biosynthesis/export family protein n=1 Tax=Flavimarina sp. Hel_I_48 TaxID=1392488 RepID=UPI0004DF09D4|nr:polysaccharide biosynthesis/export family protein [Flavimarina sp. Hel_I_48]
MNRFIQFVLVPFALLLILNSCVSKKDVLYFQDIENLREQQDSITYNTIIRPDDLLTITVSALNPETVVPFNPPLVSTPSGDGTINGARQIQTYLVDKDGTIEFPVLGSLELGGMTRQAATRTIKEKLATYVIDPIINLRILNFTISVLGEVQRPGTFTVNDERVTILEALGLAGDMTIFGEREKVQVIREENGKTRYGVLDFTSVDLINSPFYYMQQNDVIIVPPNGAQIQSSGFNRNTSVFISVAGIIISVISIFTR